MLGALLGQGCQTREPSGGSLRWSVQARAGWRHRRAENVDFAIEFLERKGIGVYGGCVGGDVARRIEFIPGDASVTLRKSPGLAANRSRPKVPIRARGYAA